MLPHIYPTSCACGVCVRACHIAATHERRVGSTNPRSTNCPCARACSVVASESNRVTNGGASHCERDVLTGDSRRRPIEVACRCAAEMICDIRSAANNEAAADCCVPGQREFSLCRVAVEHHYGGSGSAVTGRPKR